MAAAVTLLLLIMTAGCLLAVTAFTETVMFRDSLMDDAISSKQVIFRAKARSGLDCAQMCIRLPACAAFSFSSYSSEDSRGEGQCQGQSGVMTWSSNNSSSPQTLQMAPGSVTFARHVADLVRCIASGVRPLHVPALDLNIQVFCDMDWLVILRRKDGSVDFYRNWKEYQQGFGDLQGEFWIGLEPLYNILSTQTFDLMVELGDWESNMAIVNYTNFTVSPSTDKYRLLLDFVNGTVKDSLRPVTGFPFTTYDEDNDSLTKNNCADKLKGAGWYKSCTGSNIFGPYKENSSCPNKDCITWKEWHGINYALKSVQLKIRRA